MSSKKYKFKKLPYTTPGMFRGGTEILLYSFFNLGARLEWVVNDTPRWLYFFLSPFSGKKFGNRCTEGWMGPIVGLYGCGNLATTGIRSPARPSRN
jgi:hypothetical protein